jgi:hypothetical protein
MQPMLDQEKLFFELTKTIMNDKDVMLLRFAVMSETTKQAYAFMQKLLCKPSEDKMLYLFQQTCKMELVIQ